MAEQTETPGENEKTGFQAYIQSWICHPFRRRRIAEKPSFLHKMRPALALIPTTVLSSLLLSGMGRSPFIDHKFYNLVADHRSTTQAVLNLLTSMLGIWHLLVLKSLINFFTRSRLQAAKDPPRLKHLRWLKALGAHKIDPSLPWKFQFLMLSVWALALLPSSLWTGALTPNLVTRNITVPLLLPKYIPDPEGAYWNATWTPIGKPIRTSSLPLDTDGVI